MTNKRVIPTHKQKARLLQESNSTCAFCNFDDAGLLEFHHIDDDRSNTILDNLIPVCPNCHAKITAKEINQSEVISKKQNLQKNFKMEKKNEAANITINAETLNNPVVGNNNTVNITVKKQVVKKSNYTEGDLGADTQKANYISHLITRYHEYKEKEVGKENMKYGIFQASLKKEYKIGTTRTLYHLPIEKFEELAALIQKRINGTKFAKQLGKGHKNFSTFEKYVEEQIKQK